MLIRTSPDFGGFVRTRRVELGITQDELAHAVGRSRRWLYDVETGASAPTLPAVIELAKALGYQLTLEAPNPSLDLDRVFDGI
jgi:transcriptional regulator with XRE-family HTH domain